MEWKLKGKVTAFLFLQSAISTCILLLIVVVWSQTNTVTELFSTYIYIKSSMIIPMSTFNISRIALIDK